MLSGDVLADLLKPSYLTEIVVVTAWPALSVESKLQILSEVQRGRLGATPDYMLPLIVSDPEPIVRYWGLRAEARAVWVNAEAAKAASAE